MLLIELRHGPHGRTKYLFNGRAYMPVNSSDKELLEFEKELENIGDEYITIFHIQSLYDFHRYRGLPENTISTLEKLEIGESCVIPAHIANATIKRLSKSFFHIEWSLN